MRFIDKEELEALEKVIEGQELFRGLRESAVSQFEREFAGHLGRKYVHAVSSGTSANEAALAGCGIEPGDEVICPPCSFIASSLSVVALGAVPVFADVDPRTLLITAEEIEKKITEQTKVVVVVHLFGQPAEMQAILKLTEQHNLLVIEDCAQAYDAYYNGQKVGTFGNVASFSLQQSKHITSGEGGMIATDDPEEYKRMVLYSNCGMPWYQYGLDCPQPSLVNNIPTRGHFAFGHNYRMSELHAAVASVQLSKIEKFNLQRAKLVRIIENEFKEEPAVNLAYKYHDTKANYWLYPLQLTESSGFSAIEVSKIYEEIKGVKLHVYSEVNYLEKVFQDMQIKRRTSLGFPLPEHVSYIPGSCPKAEAAAEKFIPLNVHHSVEPDSLQDTIGTIRRIVREGK